MRRTRKAFAAELRRQPTEAERRLWQVLRARQLHGLKFRREHGLERYIVDFACPEARLIVELDGGQHADRAARDAARTQVLESKGYTVLRFWNNDVLENLEGVVEVIEAAVPARAPK
ncbi:DNA methylase [Rhodovibrio sodomensis]|uniref:DNA methylase n=1 Tax=Rhodovibrio sodomensis TaxID=1088 RepID=A0ABS1DIK7_9PROT|nr:endonuclease domain-containing protein [Rhodovibrio sodomensis]MBK1670330.1 DNA methylase [Rhodovibrio sodomensis]